MRVFALELITVRLRFVKPGPLRHDCRPSSEVSLTEFSRSPYVKEQFGSEPDFENFGYWRADEVTPGVGCIVSAVAIVIDVNFEDVFGMVRVVHELRQGFDEFFAARIDEEGWFDTAIGVAQT